jgi:4'-phosphopantetheinyl transferase
MSLVYKKVVSEGALLGLWKISESLEDLHATVNLTGLDQEILSKKGSERKKKEWLAVRRLLSQMLNATAEITYDAHRKPFLKDNDYYLSISHSDQYAAVYLNKAKPVGIDIQKIKIDIKKGFDFFLNAEEQLWVDKTDFMLLNILWSAKESIYKSAGVKDLDPKNQIFVSPFEAESDGVIKADFIDKNSNTLSIHYEIFEDYVLTRTL